MQQAQIESVLAMDPDSADLLALKQQLEEMIAVLTGTATPQQVLNKRFAR